MARKKPTIKEIEAKVEMLTRVNNTVVEMVGNLGNILKEYVEFKGDTKDYQEYVKEKTEARNKIIRNAK
tara:strand:- start:1245 stop:1451 length:207 start_codon:yes stop_codon:yes gene_type:complete